MNMVKLWLASLIRKVVFGASLAWLVAILKDSGATEADIDRWIEIAITLLLMIGAALWTAIKEWLAKRKNQEVK
jgi:hypothetical protein